MKEEEVPKDPILNLISLFVKLLDAKAKKDGIEIKDFKFNPDDQLMKY